LIETARRSRALGDDMVRWVEQKIAERAAARQTRDFQRADSIRDELSRRGVVLEDGAGGTKWKFVPRTEETSAPS
jgi:cysteinyl-tRNA synthetase